MLGAGLRNRLCATSCLPGPLSLMLIIHISIVKIGLVATGKSRYAVD